MQLQVFKQLPYISPSTYLQWESCQYKVFMSKLSGLQMPAGEYTRPAQIGNAFSAYVIDYIVQKRNLDAPHTNLSIALANIDDENRTVAKMAAKAYIKAKLCEPFMDAIDLKVEQELYGRIGGVPILGRLDLIVDGYPEDFKCRGFNSKAYPTTGYSKRIDWNLLTDSGQVIAPDEIDEQIDKDYWLVQLCFYNWLLCRTEAKYKIHEICYQPNKLIFVVHEGFIPRSYRLKLMKKVEQMWEAVSSNLYYAEIQQPRPSKWTCEKWNTVCKCAPVCTYYKRTLGDEQRRSHYV